MRISYYKQKAFQRHVWDFSNVCNTTLLNEEHSNIRWEEVAGETLHIDDVYDNWFNHFRSIVDKYIPNKIVTIRPRDKPWMTSVVRKAIRERNRLLKLYCNSIRFGRGITINEIIQPL